MPDALTESFCERCGTRYEFAAPTQLSTLGKTRSLVGGLRNYVMGHDSLSESMEDAMRAEQEVLAAKQLEAFHASFNFCINCRQYTCLTCWNDAAGRCQTCAPLPGTDGLIPAIGSAASAGGNGSGWAPDLAADAAAAEWPMEAMLAEAQAGPTLADESEPEPVMAAAPEPEPEPVVEPEPEPVMAAAPEPEPEPEPVVESKPKPAAPEIPTRPIPFRPIRPISETIVRIPRAAPPAKEIPAVAASVEEDASLAARRAQLDLLGLADDGEGVPAEPTVLPYRSSGAPLSVSDMAARVAARGAFWDASAHEVADAISQIGVQDCGHCGLSVSATARFCRRCGTPQARSA